MAGDAEFDNVPFSRAVGHEQIGTGLGDVVVPGGTVKRYALGESGLKLVTFNEPPVAANPPPGGGPTARGIRYLTVEVANIASTVERCTASGV